MRKLALAMLFCALGGSAFAQSYCSAGSVDAGRVALTLPEEAEAALRAKCKPGDIVFFSPQRTSLIGLSCDFSKSIVNTGDAVLCVLREPKK
jgi:hypothetical protein